MRVATNKTLDERRQYVVDLLDFIRDFNRLDTTFIKQRIWDDVKTLEAAEAVLSSAVGAWRSIEALRDFCVQTMIGEKPLEGTTERAARVSPFSVPVQLLRAMAPNPGNFNIHSQLKSLSFTDVVNVGTYIGEEQRWEKLVTGGENWLVTSIWARGIPTTPKFTRAIVTDLGANRLLHDGSIRAWTVDAMPCFWFLPSHTPLEIRFTRQREDVETELLLVVEGWRYLRQ